jgi:CII-binding regulator of phage lambda lysogenization HflD
MAYPTSLHILPAYLFRLTQQIDILYKNFQTYKMALDATYEVEPYKQIEPLKVLSQDLKKHAITLLKLERKLCELMDLELIPSLLERIDPMHCQVEELQQIYQTLKKKN